MHLHASDHAHTSHAHTPSMAQQKAFSAQTHRSSSTITPIFILGIGMVVAPVIMFGACADKAIDCYVAKSERDLSARIQEDFMPIQQQLQRLDKADMASDYERLMNSIIQFEKQFEGVKNDTAYAAFKRSYHLLEIPLLQKLLKPQEANQNNSSTVAQILPVQESSELIKERMKHLQEDANFFMLAKQKAGRVEQKKMDDCIRPMVGYGAVGTILTAALVYALKGIKSE